MIRGMVAVLKLICDQYTLVVKMRELRKEGYHTFVVNFVSNSDKFLLKTWRRLKKK